jgi:hypothetical protein
VPWVRPDNYAMWAPDCIDKGGKYYFYFPTFPKDTTRIKGFTIGVATSDHPEGPYAPQAQPIGNVRGIDPNVFVDQDGQAYLYWSQGNIYGARLKDNMLELETDPKILGELPSKGLKEGPYMFQRNGVYYLTYPHVQNKTERLEYAMGDNPLGPFKFTGVIMDESPTGCWTNHHSIIEFKNQWYLFYHHNDLSPKFDKNRSIRVDSLTFNADGTIRKVIPTLRGVGTIPASRELQLDRYSKRSEEGTSISFLDSAQVSKGWKTAFAKTGAWIQFDGVSFQEKKFTKVSARVRSDTGSEMDVRLDNVNSKAIATLKISKARDWKIISSPVTNSPQGIHALRVAQSKNGNVEIDWIRFE